ncbi:DUF5011 domain-containing protein, partial [Alkalihalophilus pseudofirmus]
MVPGDYPISYTVSDKAGNTATVKRIVKVIDSITPHLTLNGENPLTVEAGDKYDEPGAKAIDNIDG